MKFSVSVEILHAFLRNRRQKELHVNSIYIHILLLILRSYGFERVSLKFRDLPLVISSHYCLSRQFNASYNGTLFFNRQHGYDRWSVGLLNSLLVSVFVLLTRLPTDFEILSSSQSFLPYVPFLLQKTVLSNCSSTINTINEHSRMHNY